MACSTNYSFNPLLGACVFVTQKLRHSLFKYLLLQEIYQNVSKSFVMNYY